MAHDGLMFFCAICIEDRVGHPTRMDKDDAYLNCPDCSSEMQTTYTRPESPTESMLTLEHYNVINGLDNNTP
jgi:DNA-directed RNA polymerase subunit RPC12/RpoP